MPSSVQFGSILIQEGLLLPEALKVETESYSTHWRLVKGLASAQLDQSINAAGWNFFYSGIQVPVSGLGSGEQDSIRQTIFNALGKVRSQYFNCAEIISISKRRFLGIPYFTIAVHPHHIQESGFLQSHDERRSLQRHSDWALA